MAGAAVSLVSRCASVDEFVAAFRGYIHRDHVFVPTSGMIAPGRKGRMAITLADGTPVLIGEAEVLSSSQVPQGPYQKPGVRLRFVSLDEAAKDILGEIERAHSEPGLLPDGDSSGARADILAIDRGKDRSDAAMCSVVEASAPVAQMPTTLPKRMVTPPAGVGGVPGKSFAIPKIPAIPSVKRAPTPPPVAVPIAREGSEAVSGDLTVPTDPPFVEPSTPIGSPSIVVTTPASPGGKARNKTLVPRRATPPTPPTIPTLGTPEAVANAPTEPAPHKGLGPPPGRYSKTLMGVPAIAPAGATTRSAPLDDTDLATPIAWDTPEHGEVGDATERSLAPAPEVVPVTVSPEAPVAALDERAVPAVAPDTPTAPVPDSWQAAPQAIDSSNTPVVRAEAVKAPVLPPPVVATAKAPALRSGPMAPTVRTPQSMLEMGAPATATPLPGMPALTPPPEPEPPPPMFEARSFAPPPPAVPQFIDARSEPTELVRRDREGTDQLFLAARRSRPFLIALIALAVVGVGIVLGILIVRSSSSDSGKSSTSAAPVVAPPDAARAAVAVVAPPDAAVAAPPPDAAPAAVAVAAPPDAAVAVAPPPTPPSQPPNLPTSQPPNSSCSATFTTNPPGASVSVAGKRKGTTPFTVTLPCGRATASFTRPRYQAVSKPIALKPDEPAKIAVKLERPQFTLRVVTSPAGASVSIGSHSGKAPLTQKVDGFEAVTVKVSKPGYATQSKKVTVKKNGTVVTVSLKKGK